MELNFFNPVGSWFFYVHAKMSFENSALEAWLKKSREWRPRILRFVFFVAMLKWLFLCFLVQSDYEIYLKISDENNKNGSPFEFTVGKKSKRST